MSDKNEPNAKELEALRTARLDYACARMIEALLGAARVTKINLRLHEKVPKGYDADQAASKRRKLRAEFSRLVRDIAIWKDLRRDRSYEPEVRSALHRSMRDYLNSEFDPLYSLSERAKNLALGFPSPAAWKQFLLTDAVPTVNGLGSLLRRCLVCGDEFPLTRMDRRYCSEACGSLERGRGRPRARGGRSKADAVEAARKVELRVNARLQRHYDTCSQCKDGRMCPAGESLLASAMYSQDAISRTSAALENATDSRVADPVQALEDYIDAPDPDAAKKNP